MTGGARNAVDHFSNLGLRNCHLFRVWPFLEHEWRLGSWESSHGTLNLGNGWEKLTLLNDIIERSRQLLDGVSRKVLTILLDCCRAYGSPRVRGA